MTKLIDSPLSAGCTASDLAAHPGAIREVHEDVLRGLMESPHAIQRHAIGPSGSEASGKHNPRRRTCV